MTREGQAHRADPWLAVNLSFLIPGIGQLYCGAPLPGVAFLLGASALWTAIVLALVSSWGSLAMVAGLAAGLLGAVVWSLVHAHRLARRLRGPGAAEARRVRDPHLAVFLTRILPGVGHMYLRRWITGVLALLLAVVAYGAGAHPGLLPWGLFAAPVYVGAVCFWAFHAGNRRAKRSPRAGKLLCLLVGLKGVLAVALALGLRYVAVEAFAIPTGGMAPTVYGEHLEVTCPDCGYAFAFGWSEQVMMRRAGGRGTGTDARFHTPLGARCPNCGCGRFPASAVRPGDRVLAVKWLGTRALRPWDVIVFRNPQDNRQVYIKRLIGLPGETIEIVHGDVFVSTDGGRTFRVRRKPPRVQEALWQLVFDNDYRPPAGPRPSGFGRDPYPCPSWLPLQPSADARWVPADPLGRRFSFRGGGKGQEASLRLMASPDTFLPRYGYNTHTWGDREIDVVSDLKLSVAYQPQAPASRLALMLSSFEHVFRGEVGADGTVRLLHRGTDAFGPDSWRPLAEDGKIDPVETGTWCGVALVHVDLRVALWVNGREVLASRDGQGYPMDYALLSSRIRAAQAKRDPSPLPLPQLRIAGTGGPCELAHVRVLRDVYYTAPRLVHPPRGPATAFAEKLGVRQGDPGWGTMGHAITLRAFPDDPELDAFYVLGDNSPASLDSRLWTAAAPTLRLYRQGRPVYQLGTVPRYSLIGRVRKRYWPPSRFGRVD